MNDEVKFDIGDKAEALYFSVFDLTTNHQHYPTKFRRIADQLQQYALGIHSDVMDANSFMFPVGSIPAAPKKPLKLNMGK